MNALVGVARWWALSLIGTVDHLAWRGYEEYRRRHPRPTVRDVLHWTDGTD